VVINDKVREISRMGREDKDVTKGEKMTRVRLKNRREI
jgi:hypothetical protein